MVWPCLMLLDVSCSDSTVNFWKKTMEEEIQRDSALWMVDMVQECRGKTCYKSLCDVKRFLTRLAGIMTFHSCSLPSRGTQVRPLLLFFLCPGYECAMLAPTDEGLSTAAADGAQSSLYVWGQQKQPAHPGLQLQADDLVHLNEMWKLGFTLSCCHGQLQRNSHFLTPISSQKPWGCNRSTLHVVSESMWLALHLHHSYGSWTIAEGTVISLKSETLDMLSWHQWSFSFLSSLPCSKSGVEQAFKLIWTHKNI